VVDLVQDSERRIGQVWRLADAVLFRPFGRLTRLVLRLIHGFFNFRALALIHRRLARENR
jgi:hypothetical protein